MINIQTIKSFADKHLKGDPVIWTVVFALGMLSILVVYSATGTISYFKFNGNTEYYLLRHSFLVFLSFFAMWLAHKVDYRYYSKLSRLALWLSVPLLIFAWQFGVNLNDASRWITIPFLNQSFQPSDLAKLALIINLAGMLSKKQQNITDFKKALIPMLLWCGLICGLIAMTNLSTAILLFLTCMLLLFIGRIPVKYLAMLAVVGIMAVSIAMVVGQRGQTAINRVESFIKNEQIPFQAQQSYIAIATGGVTGKGPGNSSQRNFLPEAFSDFIFAIVVEEYGMIGATVVILLYLTLLYRGMKAAAASGKAYGGLLSAGLSFAIVLQAMVNMGVAVGLGPITGLPLPLLSMGGTSLLFTGFAMGIILSVSRGEIEETTEISRSNFGNLPKKDAA
ncbi:FtsW/RodA/SpoVE family cell cycle protein [Marivirga sp. S37H4]|uniref:Probable peptidoglycan glycosyltransferase FtsW n=1 Tax=Marivirga aurantiaca TaxID=2802615 RepID=A0A934X101_9BACT|nr:FtsW/RodA/SpoVE family cell cycle protein [Marivirga aurantiaca]MBK6266963.1 FtsW/RodA/SpoVE family cell cycle protein [Marivirga aurantiaca]